MILVPLDVCWPQRSGCLLLVGQALEYFSRHFPHPIHLATVARVLAVSEAQLECCFQESRGMTPFQALQQHRMNRLFQAIKVKPQQALGSAMSACGLGRTAETMALFEDTFGIDLSMFRRTCRRAASDRQFRLHHPRAEDLVVKPSRGHLAIHPFRPVLTSLS